MIILCYNLSVFELIKVYLKIWGIKDTEFEVINGSTSKAQRKLKRDKFESSTKIFLLIGTPKTLGTSYSFKFVKHISSLQIVNFI
jgi:hypothetical protein